MKSYLCFLIVLSCFFLNAQKSDFKHINFEKADSIANSYENERLNNLPLLAYKLTNNLNTQVEKFRAIHTWVCSNIESDHDFADKTIRKRKQDLYGKQTKVHWRRFKQSARLHKKDF